MKVYTLNYIDKDDKGKIEGFSSQAKAMARMKEVQRDEDPKFVDGLDMVDFPGNRDGLIMAIEWASRAVYK